MRLLVLLAALLGLPAFAQTSSQSIDSMRSPFASRVLTVTVQLLKTDPTSGAFIAISGQSVSLGSIDIVANSTLTADFPGPKLTPLSVTGLRVTVSGSGLGWVSKSLQIDVPLPVTLVPAGKGLGVRYDMPLTGSGTIQTAVGVLAATIPPPTVAGPVVTGTIPPVTPPSPPPAPTGTSPDGTSIPPSTTITDATGAVWTLLGTHPMRNGAETGGSGSAVITIKAGAVYFQQTGGQWWAWNGTGWASIPAAP